MPSVLRRLTQRITPPMLRSDSPDRPMTIRGRHWLFQETRFLFLTRKGPIEIIVKPSVIMGAAFVGTVGATVIAATTLFIGLKSVEVVRNESITVAEASAPLALPQYASDNVILQMPDTRDRSMSVADGRRLATTSASGQTKDKDLVTAKADLANGREAAEKVSPADIDLFANSDTPDEQDVVRVASLATPAIRWPSSLAATDAAPTVVIPDPTLATRGDPLSANLDEPDMMVPLPGSETLAADKSTDTTGQTEDDARGPVLPAAPETAMALVAGLFSGSALPQPPVPEPAPQGGLETDMTGNQPPVLTKAGRQLKVLRSMAREVLNIRTSLGGLGINDVLMPKVDDLDILVQTADFASLAMAVEDHRSMLRKIPLKPPMLYFYVSSEYGNRKHPVLKTKRFHHGIDLAGTWQETVQATAPGTVIFAGSKGSFGKVVQVKHAYGIITTYAHLSKITVRKGADVGVGTVVGRMGRTGRVDGAHLHYEIRIGNTSLNPRLFFAIGHRIGVGGELLRVAD